MYFGRDRQKSASTRKIHKESISKCYSLEGGLSDLTLTARRRRISETEALRTAIATLNQIDGFVEDQTRGDRFYKENRFGNTIQRLIWT